MHGGLGFGQNPHARGFDDSHSDSDDSDDGPRFVEAWCTE
jgi:hypothetical protein